MSAEYESISAGSYRTSDDQPIINTTDNSITVTENSNGSYTLSAAPSEAIGLQVVTDGTGHLTIDLTPYGFTAPPRATITPVSPSANSFTAQINNISATSMTIASYQATIVSVLGISVSLISIAGSVTVDIILVRQ
jgi:hypothetical protein